MTGDAPDTYTVEDVDAVEEISPFWNAHVETHDGRDYVEFNCPSCEHSLEPSRIVKEGGGKCPGCGRTVRLHVTSEYAPPENSWNNVPPEHGGDFA